MKTLKPPLFFLLALVLLTFFTPVLAQNYKSDTVSPSHFVSNTPYVVNSRYIIYFDIDDGKYFKLKCLNRGTLDIEQVSPPVQLVSDLAYSTGSIAYEMMLLDDDTVFIATVHFAREGSYFYSRMKAYKYKISTNTVTSASVGAISDPAGYCYPPTFEMVFDGTYVWIATCLMVDTYRVAVGKVAVSSMTASMYTTSVTFNVNNVMHVSCLKAGNYLLIQLITNSNGEPRLYLFDTASNAFTHVTTFPNTDIFYGAEKGKVQILAEEAITYENYQIYTWTAAVSRILTTNERVITLITYKAIFNGTIAPNKFLEQKYGAAYITIQGTSIPTWIWGVRISQNVFKAFYGNIAGGSNVVHSTKFTVNNYNNNGQPSITVNYARIEDKYVSFQYVSITDIVRRPRPELPYIYEYNPSTKTIYIWYAQPIELFDWTVTFTVYPEIVNDTLVKDITYSITFSVRSAGANVSQAKVDFYDDITGSLILKQTKYTDANGRAVITTAYPLNIERENVTWKFEVSYYGDLVYLYTHTYCFTQPKYYLNVSYEPSEYPLIKGKTYVFTIKFTRNLVEPVQGTVYVYSMVNNTKTLIHSLTTGKDGTQTFTVIADIPVVERYLEGYYSGRKVAALNITYAVVEEKPRTIEAPEDVPVIISQTLTNIVLILPIIIVILLFTFLFAQYFGGVGAAIGFAIGVIMSVAVGLLPFYYLYVMVLILALLLVIVRR